VVSARRLDVVRDPGLPRNAWCARARRGSAVVEVRHGSGVERVGDGIFEGTWAGDFAAGEFAHCPVRMGTGLGVDGSGRLMLVAPSHPFRAVAVARRGTELLASNSLVFLLAEAGSVPVHGRATYHRDLFLTSQVPDDAPTLEFTGGLRVDFISLDRVVVDRALARSRQQVPHGMRLDDFASYRDEMVGALAGLAANAQSPARRRPLRLVATLSRGYDSTGAAALGRDAGWRDAVTLGRGPDDPDDGTVVGDALGYRVERCPADAWQDAGPLPEAEYLAAGGPSLMVRMTSMEPAAAGAALLMGSHGDLAWSRRVFEVGPRFERRFDPRVGPEGLGEWELRTGSSIVPVPSIGAEDPAPLRRLYGAPEMAPWTLGRKYDRPVPRRLLEARGVPRDAFGVRKQASSHVVAPGALTPASRADYDAWLADHPVSLRSRLRSTGRREQWETGHLFHWAVERTMARYR
jgi:hypothetical protein